MITSELEILCCKVCGIAASAAEYISSQSAVISAKDIEHKGLHDLVSFVDKAAEEQILRELALLIPSSNFLAEESEKQNKLGDATWIVDPLDGTTNFLHGLPFYAVSIGLAIKGEIVLGVIHEIANNRSFYAWKNGGAYQDGKRIQVSSNSELTNSLVATGFPYYNYEALDPYLICFRTFLLETRGVRRIGSAALDLAYVANGTFDFYFEYCLQPWDIAAGIIIVAEAGGKLTDLAGGDEILTTGCIIAASQAIYPNALKIIQPAFAGVEFARREL